jgi:hypothetical protein
MRSLPAFLLAALLAFPVLVSGDGLSPDAALASGRDTVRMDILVDGRVAREYRGRGKTYVQAYKGKEYRIRLSNDSAERVAVALSVDGLNTIDARRTTAVASTKWVLGPWEQIEIDGWQVGPDHARAFVFTSEESSYGSWLGETRNLGVISAAFFREVVHYEPCCDDPAPYTSGGSWDGDFDGRLGDGSGSYDRSRRDAPEPEESVALDDVASSAPAGKAGGAGRSSSRRGPSTEAAEDGYYSPSKPKKERAGTGTGRRVQHSVEWVPFELDADSQTTLGLRYGFRSELVELGILPKPRKDTSLTRRESASGFAPDPGSGCCR